MLLIKLLLMIPDPVPGIKRGGCLGSCEHEIVRKG